MLRTDEILSTIHMLHAEHLDVRAVTLALNVDDCAAPNVDHLCKKLRGKLTSRHADRYAAVGQPVDLSWVVSKEAVVARWKPSDEDTWQVLHSETSHRLVNLRLRFAGSWCEFTVDAVQVSKQDLSRKPAQ